MNSGLMRKKYRETLLPGLLSLLVMAGILIFLVINGYLFAADMDDQIEAAAQKSYVFKTYLKGDDIRIDCRDGVVTLTGTVANEPHSALAAETVADLPGVKSVNNLLAVKEGIPETNSDAWIRIRVMTMLMLHANVDGAHTGVEVLDGRVTLRGEAGSHAEKELTSEYARDVEGVEDIRNEMTVRKEPNKEHRTIEEFIDDASIKAQIKLALAFHRGTSPFRADIEVRKGVVTVSGKAKNAQEKELVSKRIEDIRGVISIRNRMIIE